MHQKKVSNTTIKIILIFTFTTLVVVLFFALNNRKNTNQQQHLTLITERYQLAYNTIFDQYEQLATSFYSGLLSRFDILEVYQQLLTADEEQKNRLRQELFDQIKQRYGKLEKVGLLKRIQFHLPNNEVFLRLHRPGKYGDDVTDIRQTVTFVNREHVAINGFEIGRMFGGYRYVFPITGTDQTYLGNMEISFGPAIITSSIMKQYYVLSNFYISEEHAIRNAFPYEQQTIYTPSHHKGYFFNNNVLAALKQISRKEMKELQPQGKITDAIYANAQSGKAISLYDPDMDMVVTTIPVLNPVTHEMVAFCTIRSQSDFFVNEREHFRLIFIVSLLLLTVCFLTFFVQYKQRKILEAHSNTLEKQKQELLETQAILKQERDVFMNGPVITFTWQNNDNWAVEHVSKNVIDILGYSAEEFFAGSVQYSALIHQDDLQRVMDEVAGNSLPEVNSFIHEPYRLISRAGEVIWVLDSTTLVRNSQGDVTHYQGYLVDITKRVLMEEEVVATKDRLKISQQEEQLKRFESLKTMASAIAHRFNNAMTAVQGSLDLLTIQLPDDSKEWQIAEDGARAAKGASQVGTMMLSFVGQRHPELHRFPLVDLVRESVIAMKNFFLPAISLQFVEPAQPLYCLMDQQQIKEVIESILTNAVESLEESAGTIEISFGTDSYTASSFPIPFQDDSLQDGLYTFCQIKDSGHGISPESLSHIFEPFYTTRFVGRGLGLALTVGIMQRHHGAVTAESTPNKGTTVRVLLPALSETQ